MADSSTPRVAGLLLAAGAGRRFGGPKALVELDGEALVQRALRALSAAGCSPVRVVIGASADTVRALLPDPAQAIHADGWESGMGASLKAGLTALAAAFGDHTDSTDTTDTTDTGDSAAPGDTADVGIVDHAGTADRTDTAGSGTGGRVDGGTTCESATVDRDRTDRSDTAASEPAGGVGAIARGGNPVAATSDNAAAADDAPVAALVHLVDLPWVPAEALARVVAKASPTAVVRAAYGGVPGHPVLFGRRWWGEVAASARGDRGARDWLRGRSDVVLVECGDLGSGQDVDRPADLRRTPEPGA